MPPTRPPAAAPRRSPRPPIPPQVFTHARTNMHAQIAPQAVLVNSGWEAPGRGDAAVAALARVPLDRLAPVGERLTRRLTLHLSTQHG